MERNIQRGSGADLVDLFPGKRAARHRGDVGGLHRRQAVHQRLLDADDPFESQKRQPGFGRGHEQWEISASQRSCRASRQRGIF